jgi:hypothetical protein
LHKRQHLLRNPPIPDDVDACYAHALPLITTQVRGELEFIRAGTKQMVNRNSITIIFITAFFALVDPDGIPLAKEDFFDGSEQSV